MTHSPEDVAALLVDAPVPWGVAGGWAIDLALGHQTRPHDDTDVVAWLDDANRLVDHLGPEWDVQAVQSGDFRPWAERGGATQAWVRPRGGAWAFELLFEQRDGDEWAFRRNTEVRAPAERLFGDVVDGVPLIWLPIALLYKAKRHRPTDEKDLRAALPLLDPSERTWLHDAIVSTHGDDHPWAGLLA